jgi:hypothetical protein
MNRFSKLKDTRARVLQSPMLLMMGVISIVIIIAAGLFLRPKAAPVVPASAPVLAANSTPFPSQSVAAGVPSTHRKPTMMETSAQEPPVRPQVAAPAPEEPIRALELRFRGVRNAEERAGLAGEIALRNSAEAVHTIARLFQTERHPSVKVALLAGLSDIDEDEAPEARFTLVTSALKGQARDVRTTALDILERLEEPRATELIRRTATSDPDQEVRDLAAALLSDRSVSPGITGSR